MSSMRVLGRTIKGTCGTFEKLKENYWWLGIYKDVTYFVKATQYIRMCKELDADALAQQKQSTQPNTTRHLDIYRD